jgi:hypothetical protein
MTPTNKRADLLARQRYVGEVGFYDPDPQADLIRLHLQQVAA